MTQADLRLILFNAGIPASRWQLPDTGYEPCSAGYVRRNWEAWLDCRPAELVVFGDIGGKRVRVRPLWKEECGDCDNLALGTMSWADVGNALTAITLNTARGGLAYGTLFYVAGPSRPENFQVSGGHAINWFVDYDLTLRFFEPGMGQVVDLNSTERASACFGIAA